MVGGTVKTESRDRRQSGQPPQGQAERLAPGLYLVATPIGHAQDITLRALDVLEAADVIYCEDTRVSQKLFHLHGMTPSRLKPAHDHNEDKAARAIIADIRAGKAVAYVSDAGLPLISDPGHIIVREVLAENLPLTSIPGANAALTALQLSGLPALPFYFGGFLPSRSKARRDALAALATLPATLVFYEAPHRLCESLADMKAVLGDRAAAYARELTKMYEDVVRGRFSSLLAYLEEMEKVKGEIVIVVGPPEKEQGPAGDDVDALLRRALETMSPRDAAFDVAARTGLARRDLYQRILALKK